MEEECRERKKDKIIKYNEEEEHNNNKANNNNLSPSEGFLGFEPLRVFGSH